MRTIYVNPRTILLDIDKPNNKVYLDNFHIEKIKISSKEELKLGDEINVEIEDYNTYFKCNYIYKEDINRVRINEFEENLSSNYMLPLLELKKEHLLLGKNFINCYVKHYDYKHTMGEYLYLMYRYTTAPYYSKFISILQKVESCIHYQKDRDQRFDCFIFKVPPKFVNDINLLLKGQYSKISEPAKKVILAFHNQTNPETPLHQVLYKGELRKNELETLLGITMPDNVDYDEMPRLADETWNYSK